MARYVTGCSAQQTTLPALWGAVRFQNWRNDPVYLEMPIRCHSVGLTYCYILPTRMAEHTCFGRYSVADRSSMTKDMSATKSLLRRVPSRVTITSGIFAFCGLTAISFPGFHALKTAL